MFELMSSLCVIDGLISPWESLISRMLNGCFPTLRHILIDIPEKISEAREETNRFLFFHNKLVNMYKFIGTVLNGLFGILYMAVWFNDVNK